MLNPCSITPTILSILHMWPPNKKLQHAIITTVLQIVFFIRQRSRDHFNLLILLSCNCNNLNKFVTVAKHKVKTVCRWCKCIETCSSAYGI